MQTARVTVLMTPEKKAAMEAVAAGLGVSTGEYMRLAVDNFRPSTDEEQELALVVEELNAAMPKMLASLDRTAAMLENTHQYVDGILREMRLRT